MVGKIRTRAGLGAVGARLTSELSRVLFSSKTLKKKTARVYLIFRIHSYRRYIVYIQ